jgi:hypothetical protein
MSNRVNNKLVNGEIANGKIASNKNTINHINTWNIQVDEQCDQKIRQEIDLNFVHNNTMLLDLTKSSYSLIEKYIYDIAMFHFARLNITDMENHFVEFWCKSKFETHPLHIDCDETLKKTCNQYEYPLLSCVTYLNDASNNPTIITNVDLECYKYKEFEEQCEIVLSLPIRNKHIAFDGHFFHGSTTLSHVDDTYMNELNVRYIIAINLWNKKPTHIEYYIPNEQEPSMNNATENNNNNNAMEDNNIMFKKDVNLINLSACVIGICSVNVSNDIINFNLFNDILYNKKTDTCYVFNELIQKWIVDNSSDANGHITTFKFVLDNSIKEKQRQVELKNKYGDIMDDFKAIIDKTIDLKYNRFLQRFTFPNLYSSDMCNYIVGECERYASKNGGWTVDRHTSYPTTDLPVDKIPSIFGLILETLKTITSRVSSSYGLHNEMSINVKDLFVVKYSHDAQNHLEMHCDGSFLSFSILLNDSSEFDGGGTYFDDGLTCFLNKGDMLLHSSQIKHSGLPITRGKRYLLVGFMNVDM